MTLRTKTMPRRERLLRRMADKKLAAADSTTPPPEETREEREARIARYNLVVDHAQLQTVQLISTKFDVKPHYFQVAEERPDDVALHLDVSPTDFGFDATSGIAGIFIMFNAGVSLGEEKLVECEARYFVPYGGLDGCDEDACKAFLMRVGKFTAYPYYRSLFANLNSSANTNLPVLPVLREAVSAKRTQGATEKPRSKETRP